MLKAIYLFSIFILNLVIGDGNKQKVTYVPQYNDAVQVFYDNLDPVHQTFEIVKIKSYHDDDLGQKVTTYTNYLFNQDSNTLEKLFQDYWYETGEHAVQWKTNYQNDSLVIKNLKFPLVVELNKPYTISSIISITFIDTFSTLDFLGSYQIKNGLISEATVSQGENTYTLYDWQDEGVGSLISAFDAPDHTNSETLVRKFIYLKTPNETIGLKPKWLDHILTKIN